MKSRSWNEYQFREAVRKTTSIRKVLQELGLRETGGNYAQIKKYLTELKVDSSHFKGQGWSKSLRGIGKPRLELDQILTKSSLFQSYKLKNRLFSAGLKQRECEICGWAKMSEDGRIPLELDHINGDRTDNRLENLRVLCPNCHSLQPTHRGRNKKS